MLFLTSYRWRENLTEEQAARALKLFGNWKPPGVIKSHYARSDGGGIVIAEADSALVLTEMTGAFLPFCEFDVTPIVEITEAVPVFQRVVAWRDSVR